MQPIPLHLWLFLQQSYYTPNITQEREDLELGGNTLKLTVKPDKKDWNAEKPAKQFTASSIAKNKVLVVKCIKNIHASRIILVDYNHTT